MSMAFASNPEPEKPLAKDAHARSAAAQGSVIPLNWVATPEAPVPVVRCIQIKKDGVRCGRWSLRGYTKCKTHAGPGALMKDGNVNKYAASVIEAARLRIVDSTDEAIDVLFDLWQKGSGEAIRLKAAETILDRAGIRGGFEVDVDIVVHESPVAEIKKRLSELKKGAEAVDRIEHPDIVEGEIVDGTEQLTLFDTEEDTDEHTDS
jgi:hypothetical protein